jgi:hypothetical protein
MAPSQPYYPQQPMPAPSWPVAPGPSPQAEPPPSPIATGGSDSPPVAPAGDEQPRIAARRVRFDFDITGISLDSSYRQINESLEGIRAEVERCRDEHDHEFRVSAHVSEGGRILQASSGYRQPAANCAVRAIRGLGRFRVAEHDVSGIVSITVTLPAR